jgi:Flp pilus assembly protein TadD
VASHYQRGWDAGSAGRIEEAVGHFRTAASLAPDVADTQYQLGYSLALLGQYAEALEPLATANALSPGQFLGANLRLPLPGSPRRCNLRRDA